MVLRNVRTNLVPSFQLKHTIQHNLSEKQPFCFYSWTTCGFIVKIKDPRATIQKSCVGLWLLTGGDLLYTQRGAMRQENTW
jgi:hypothetical protein